MDILSWTFNQMTDIELLVWLLQNMKPSGIQRTLEILLKHPSTRFHNWEASDTAISRYLEKNLNGYLEYKEKIDRFTGETKALLQQVIDEYEFVFTVYDRMKQEMEKQEAVCA